MVISSCFCLTHLNPACTESVGKRIQRFSESIDFEFSAELSKPIAPMLHGRPVNTSELGSAKSIHAWITNWHK